MRGFYRAVVRRRALILTLFLLAAAAGLVLRQLVYVNYDVNDYLPGTGPQIQPAKQDGLNGFRPRAGAGV